MPGRIVLYGATGYIGGLTAGAMVASGSRPVLEGRHQGRLTALAEQLSRAGGGIKLETVVAGSEEPGPLRELIGAGDVLVSTAGPFLKVGRSVVVVAVDAGAVYLDSSGEPPFIRQMFEEFGPRAERTGAVLLTSFGYDYVVCGRQDVAPRREHLPELDEQRPEFLAGKPEMLGTSLLFRFVLQHAVIDDAEPVPCEHRVAGSARAVTSAVAGRSRPVRRATARP